MIMIILMDCFEWKPKKGLLVKKSGETMNGFITNKVRNNDTKSTTVTTTTEWPISVAQPTTVDIETLPGNENRQTNNQS